MKKFPKIIYVKTDQSAGTEFFVADENPASLVEMGEKVRIAKYQLVETNEAEGIASFGKARRA